MTLRTLEPRVRFAKIDAAVRRCLADLPRDARLSTRELSAAVTVRLELDRDDAKLVGQKLGSWAKRHPLACESGETWRDARSLTHPRYVWSLAFSGAEPADAAPKTTAVAWADGAPIVHAYDPADAYTLCGGEGELFALDHKHVTCVHCRALL